jgi:hypothetical protein
MERCALTYLLLSLRHIQTTAVTYYRRGMRSDYCSSRDFSLGSGHYAKWRHRQRMQRPYSSSLQSCLRAVGKRGRFEGQFLLNWFKLLLALKMICQSNMTSSSRARHCHRKSQAVRSICSTEVGSCCLHRQQVGDVKKSDLPGTEALNQPGRSGCLETLPPH